MAEARRSPAGLQATSEVRDGMRIDWDVAITMDDGLVLRADVYRPVKDGKYPVIMTYGPYAKGLHFTAGYKGQRLAFSFGSIQCWGSRTYRSRIDVSGGIAGAYSKM